MKLFDEREDKTKNWLPQDGIVNYFGKILGHNQADAYYEKLLSTIDWKNDEVVLFGKKIITKRKVAWYAEKPFEYTYSNISKQALPWTKELLELKTLVEEQTNDHYNSCLLNLYQTGEQAMGWHSDNEADLKENAAISSLSLGAERKFVFKHKTTSEKVELVLQHGSLLVMKGTTQSSWVHRLPPTKVVRTPRINLTFRTIRE